MDEAMILRHFCVGGAAAVFGYYMVPMMRNIAVKWGIVDKPDGRVKRHKEAVPYLGGLAVYMAFIAPIALCYPLYNKVLWFVLANSLLLFVGLIDDLYDLRPWQKLAGQVFAVICFLRGGVHLKNIFLSAPINLFLTGFWMLSVINAFNLVDVMDGLATSLGLVSGIFFLGIAIALRLYTLSLLVLALVVALFFFLRLNYPPARMYLGDSGSLFIGGFFAALPILFPSWSQQRDFGYLVPMAMLAVPLLEVTMLVIIRTRKGIPFYKGSPHHFSSYLKDKGWSAEKILYSSGLIAVLLCLTSVGFFFYYLDLVSFLGLSGAIVATWFVVVFL